jgi:hypothetical protein
MKFLNTILIIVVGSSSAFTPHYQNVFTRNESQLNMGIFDDLKLIFSDEGKESRAAYEEQKKEEQEEAQRIIMERRRNPDVMAEYEQSVNSRRQKLEKDAAAWDFQKDTSGADPLEKWNERRASGEITAGSDIERDPSSSRLGSEGLQEIRTDDKLPYVEQGYVDEDADVLGNLKKMFGKNK